MPKHIEPKDVELDIKVRTMGLESALEKVNRLAVAGRDAAAALRELDEAMLPFRGCATIDEVNVDVSHAMNVETLKKVLSEEYPPADQVAEELAPESIRDVAYRGWES